MDKKTSYNTAFAFSEYDPNIKIPPWAYSIILEKEGILFLDEINCVSETLAPIMLQFLQYKTFGKHKIPDGYLVVTAGNPPEYNNSARGWEDLSLMIKLYEKHNFDVTYEFIIQYVQNKKIATNFAIYYDLYKKYQSDYKVLDILEGKSTDEISNRAKNAKFDERLALISLMIDALAKEISQIDNTDFFIEIISEFKIKKDISSILITYEESIKKALTAKSISTEYARSKINILNIIKSIELPTDDAEAFKILKKEYDKINKKIIKDTKKVSEKMNNAIIFCDDNFKNGQELFVLLTEITNSTNFVEFISNFGSEQYFKHNKDLLLNDTRSNILSDIDEIIDVQ